MFFNLSAHIILLFHGCSWLDILDYLNNVLLVFAAVLSTSILPEFVWRHKLRQLLLDPHMPCEFTLLFLFCFLLCCLLKKYNLLLLLFYWMLLVSLSFCLRSIFQSVFEIPVYNLNATGDRQTLLYFLRYFVLMFSWIDRNTSTSHISGIFIFYPVHL